MIWISFAAALIITGGLKSWRQGWLQSTPTLDLHHQPAILVFLKFRYACDCEQIVNDNARRQLAVWSVEDRGGVQLHLVDVSLQAQAAQQYKVFRTPSLVLVNERGEIVWRQDGVTRETSDGFPLNLSAVEFEISELLQSQESLK